mgnify:CR=1 FL=1
MEKTYLITWDDFSPLNLKLARLLRQYDLEAIFFIECDKDYKIEQIKMLADLGFEIGSHTIHHPQDLKRLSKIDAWCEIADSRRILQEVTKQTIDWFCYPRGRYNEKIIDMVRQAGYKYARTTKIYNDNNNDENLTISGGVHCFQRQEYGKVDWLDFAKNFIKENKIVRIWGHAWEIEKNNEWDKLEELFEFIRSLKLK